MALAEELLDNISEEQAAEYALSELKPHIVIDEDRNIILPERYKKIASQGDHNMATYTFDCPRFSDGRDMSKMVVYINYIRSDGETGSYPADNVSIDAQNTDLMHFDWTLLLPATIEEGVLAFLVCVCKTGNDGKIENHWSSRMCREAMISEAMDCHKDTIVDLYPDIITRILERLNVLEDGGTTSVQYTIQDLEEEQKAQARKNIGAADAAEVSKLSEDIATKASAIKEKASGEPIIVTDSDEQEPLELAIDGKSTQDGEPTPDNHIEIVNVGKYDEASGKYAVEVKCTTEDGSKETTATVLLDEPLRGLPVPRSENYTDSNGQRYVSDEIVKHADGSGERVNRVLEHTLSKNDYISDMSAYAGVKDNHTNFRVKLSGVKKEGYIISNILPTKKHVIWAGDVLGCSCIEANAVDFTMPYEVLGITKDATANERVSAMKTYLENHEVCFYAELAEPITEEIDIDLGKLSMFYPTTVITNDCNANMEVTYIADTKAYIDKKFAELATAMV